MNYDNGDVFIRAYCEETVDGRYPAALANSVHFAWSENGRDFQPFHRNYGMLFIEGRITERNTIRSLGVADPQLVVLANGEYGVLACPVDNEPGQYEQVQGLQYWTTRDFIDFEDHGLIDAADVLAAGSDTARVHRTVFDRMRRHWDPIEHVATRVPERITAACADDVASVWATACYSDGSTARKRVQWDTSTVNFSVPGEYPVTGAIVDRRYPFPLAEGYGDPVIFPWKGKYYFLGTNDNLNDIGIYIREADTPEELFATDVEQHLILPYDESRGLMQTFWAPEFHVIGGEAYILFAVSGRQWAPQCHVMRLKSGQSLIDPGSWEDPVSVCRCDGGPLAPNAISLDMTYVESGSTGYMVWSYREHIGQSLDTGSMLYIATVDKREPWRLTSEPVLLSRPLLGWENVAGTINNEGPNSFIANGTIYLTYSGGDACGYTYALGLLTAKVGDDLTNVGNWKKRNTPVLSFRSIDGVYGPGHNAFFVDPEGNLMISYHGETSIDSRLRCDGIHRVHCGVDGVPVFDLAPTRDLSPSLCMVSSTVSVR